MNFITKKIEKKLGVDLNGDGVIGSGYGRGGKIVGKIEEATHIDLNKDGVIGKVPPPYYGYGGPPYSSNYNRSGNQGMVNELERATNIDINGDGRIGGGPPPFSNYPPPHNSYGGPPYSSNYNQSGNQGMINELEKATNIDLNRDGRIGGGPPPFSNYPPPHNSYGGPPYSSNYNQSGNQGMINELEKATNIDLNRDGRIGGGPPPFSNYPPPHNSYGGPPYSSNYNQSGNQGMINELEKATNIDINGDGRIGGGPPPFSNYPPPHNSYGGPPYSSNYNQYGNSGLLNELEKATNIDLNRDGKIGGGPPPMPGYNPFGY